MTPEARKQVEDLARERFEREVAVEESAAREAAYQEHYAKLKREHLEKKQRAFQERVARLVAIFNGAIKYTPMLTDHPHWSDEECVAFARAGHARAIEGLRAHGVEGAWNDAVPYCRNIPTEAMLKEANDGRA